MRSTAAARRYARALFALSEAEGAVESTRSELADIKGLLDANPDLERSLFRPLHPVAERRSVLASLCERGGTRRTLRNFFCYLVDQRRLVDFAAIRAEFVRLADEAAGRLRAQVLTASPLSQPQRERLQHALARRTGKQIDLEVRVDPSLIGGAIATVGGLVLDGSLRTQLSQLRVNLTQSSMPRGDGDPQTSAAASKA